MDPLSEVFGSMRIDKATYTRLEATPLGGFAPLVGNVLESISS